MRYRIGKFLDASTDQIPGKDLDILTAHQEVPDEEHRDLTLMRIIPHRYGWWINVQHGDADLDDAIACIKTAGLSPKFLALFKVAAENKCDWINLDRDA